MARAQLVDDLREIAEQRDDPQALAEVGRGRRRLLRVSRLLRLCRYRYLCLLSLLRISLAGLRLDLLRRALRLGLRGGPLLRCVLLGRSGLLGAGLWLDGRLLGLPGLRGLWGLLRGGRGGGLRLARGARGERDDQQSESDRREHAPEVANHQLGRSCTGRVSVGRLELDLHSRHTRLRPYPQTRRAPRRTPRRDPCRTRSASESGAAPRRRRPAPPPAGPSDARVPRRPQARPASLH